MRKEELILALMKAVRNAGKSGGTNNRRNGHESSGGDSKSSVIDQSSARLLVEERIHQLRSKIEGHKSLASKAKTGSPKGKRDRLVVMVRDPYWLQAFWELSPRSVERAQTAMGQYWHNAQPVLRLLRLQRDGSLSLERVIRVHGGVNHWYVDVSEPPCEFQMEIGYQCGEQRFHCLARSNTVATPNAGTSDSIDANWASVSEDADRIYAMSGGYSPRGTSRELQELLEERLKRPMGSPMQTRYGGGAMDVPGKPSEFQFAVDAELVVFGVSHPRAHVTIQGEPISLKQDGGFAVRIPMPDRRQVIPVVASSGDGVVQRTVLLAVERNTKALEPIVRLPGE
jgi:hypothetical protein